ncbi:MAG: very short patch repair endonuclease [Oscillospiraceae bacterium]|jgi:DNA mismatch endonuclease Vsr|nr:very short patch repair endonuclease [Oscillospiraceae bacterium]
MDKHTPEQRRRNMQAIKCKDTKIEVLLRKELWSRGIRYRKNVSSILGKPDIAILGYKIAIFCDSEFWHGFDWEHKKEEIKSHRDFWYPKIERTMARDAEVNKNLQEQGWMVLRFWGHEIETDVNSCADLIVKVLKERNECSTKQ